MMIVLAINIVSAETWSCSRSAVVITGLEGPIGVFMKGELNWSFECRPDTVWWCANRTWFPKAFVTSNCYWNYRNILTFWEIHELDETIVPALCAIKINTEGNSLCPEVNRPHYGLCTVLLHNMLERVRTTRLFFTSGPVQTICLCHFLIFNQDYFVFAIGWRWWNILLSPCRQKSTILKKKKKKGHSQQDTSTGAWGMWIDKLK